MRWEDKGGDPSCRCSFIGLVCHQCTSATLSFEKYNQEEPSACLLVSFFLSCDKRPPFIHNQPTNNKATSEAPLTAMSSEQKSKFDDLKGTSGNDDTGVRVYPTDVEIEKKRGEAAQSLPEDRRGREAVSGGLYDIREMQDKKPGEGVQQEDREKNEVQRGKTA
ncbi:hypothetical protein QOT17_010854 [Balamuthia mandrillaris]